MEFVSALRAPPHNAHYEGDYSDTALRWRRTGGADKADNLAALLGGEQVDTVLEVGCGTGCVLAMIRDRGIGSRHVGVDMADPNLHRDPMTEGLTLLSYDGTTLPFEDDAFDLVYASHVLEHVPDERGFLAELARVAKRFVYLEVPCELTARSTQARLQSSLNIGHINAYTPASFVLTLETSALKPVRFKLFSHSDAMATFDSASPGSRFAALAIERVRRLMLKGPLGRFAHQFFVYHCGALCTPQRD